MKSATSVRGAVSAPASAASKKIALSRIALPSIALVLTSHADRDPTGHGLPSPLELKSGSSKGPVGQQFDFMKTIDLRDEHGLDEHGCATPGLGGGGGVRFLFDIQKRDEESEDEDDDGDSDTDSIRTVFHPNVKTVQRPGTSRGFKFAQSQSDRSSFESPHSGRQPKRCSDSTSTPSLLMSALRKLRPEIRSRRVTGTLFFKPSAHR